MALRQGVAVDERPEKEYTSMDKAQILEGIKADSLVERMIGVMRLDKPTFEAIEADQSAIPQAATVVLIAAVATGIGSIGDAGIVGLLVGLVMAPIGWALFSAMAYLIGTKVLAGPETKADVGEVLRTLGFAQAPGIIATVAFIPVLGILFSLIASFWGLFAAIVALKTSLEVSTGRAIAIGLLAAIAAGLVLAPIAVALGVSALVVA
jgi:hypothetical protein